MLKVWKNFLRSVNNLKSKFMEDLNSTKRKAEGELSDLESKRLKSEVQYSSCEINFHLLLE